MSVARLQQSKSIAISPSANVLLKLVARNTLWFFTSLPNSPAKSFLLFLKDFPPKISSLPRFNSESVMDNLLFPTFLSKSSFFQDSVYFVASLSAIIVSLVVLALLCN
ncbi:hypothetical protein GIB67_022502, partial [Kingdonia uniflora]